ncbi:hypothetical protein ACFX13_032118 [Malus domestica]
MLALQQLGRLESSLPPLPLLSSPTSHSLSSSALPGGVVFGCDYIYDNDDECKKGSNGCVKLPERINRVKRLLHYATLLLPFDDSSLVDLKQVMCHIPARAPTTSWAGLYRNTILSALGTDHALTHDIVRFGPRPRPHGFVSGNSHENLPVDHHLGNALARTRLTSEFRWNLKPVEMDEEGKMRFATDNNSKIIRGFYSYLVLMLDDALLEEMLRVKTDVLLSLSVGLQGGCLIMNPLVGLQRYKVDKYLVVSGLVKYGTNNAPPNSQVSNASRLWT